MDSNLFLLSALWQKNNNLTNWAKHTISNDTNEKASDLARQAGELPLNKKVAASNPREGSRRISWVKVLKTY